VKVGGAEIRQDGPPVTRVKLDELTGATTVKTEQIEIKGRDTSPKNEDVKPDQEALAKAVDKLNQTARIFDRSIQFSIDKRTDRYWVKVVDTETHKIVREIPPREVLDMLARINEAVGVIIDSRR